MPFTRILIAVILLSTPLAANAGSIAALSTYQAQMIDNWVTQYGIKEKLKDCRNPMATYQDGVYTLGCQGWANPMIHIEEGRNGYFSLSTGQVPASTFVRRITELLPKIVIEPSKNVAPSNTGAAEVKALCEDQPGDC